MSVPRSRSQLLGFERSPGEQAFDRCILPFGLYFLVVLAYLVFGFALRGSEAASSPVPFFPGSCLVLEVLGTIHWSWALLSVCRAWADPTARVLRFASLGLLALTFAVLSLLLRAQFQSS